MKSLATSSFRAERAALILAAVMLALIVAHVLAMQAYFNPALGLRERFGFQYWHVAVFDLDEEESFGTWFSSGLLATAAVLLLHQVRVLRAQGGSWHRWWLVLAIGFCVLSIDEVVGIHEYAGTLMEDTHWTVIGFPLVVLVALAYVPFLWRYRWRTALLFLVAGVVFGSGAVGVEHFTDSEVNSLHYNMWTALEEGLEMAGAILFIYALLDHARGSAGRSQMP